MQLPLAFKSIMLGINQMILMVLATVIIAGLIGGGALGLEASAASQKPNLKMGHGVAAGVSIVLLAIDPRPDHPGLGQPVGTGQSHTVNCSELGTKGENMRTRIRTSVRFAAGAAALALVAVACGSDSKSQRRHHCSGRHRAAPPTAAPAATPRQPQRRRGIKLAVNPWTGSAVNANVAKVVLESQARHAGRVRRPRRERHVGRPRRRRASTPCSSLAVGSRRRLQDLHHREEERRRPRPARPGGQDRLVRADVRRRRAPRAGDVGRVQGPRAGQAVRHRRVRRPRPVPDGRPELRHLRRADHRQPRPAAEVRRRPVPRPRCSPRSSRPMADQKPLLLQFWQPHWMQLEGRAHRGRSCPTSPTPAWHRPRPPTAGTPATTRSTSCTRRPTPGSRPRTRRRSTSCRSSS